MPNLDDRNQVKKGNIFTKQQNLLDVESYTNCHQLTIFRFKKYFYISI